MILDKDKNGSDVEKMTLRDFFNTGWCIDFDVVNKCFDADYSFYCNLTLSAEGERHFANILDLDCLVDEEYGLIEIDLGDETSEDLIKDVNEFCACYASASNYSNCDRWFVEGF